MSSSQAAAEDKKQQDEDEPSEMNKEGEAAATSAFVFGQSSSSSSPHPSSSGGAKKNKKKNKRRGAAAASPRSTSTVSSQPVAVQQMLTPAQVATHFKIAVSATKNPNNNNAHLLQTSIPDLKPQVVVASTGDFCPINEAAEAVLGEYECAICNEILQNPVGCGLCSGRFCNECLEMSSRTSSSDRRSASSSGRIGTNSKCPTCRSNVFALISDPILLRELSFKQVKCRYAKCRAGEMALSMIRTHETVCSAQPVACRFAMYGCDWKGLRGDIQQHEESSQDGGCKMASIQDLLEELRKMRLEQHQEVTALKAQQLAFAEALADAELQRRRETGQLRENVEALQRELNAARVANHPQANAVAPSRNSVLYQPHNPLHWLLLAWEAVADTNKYVENAALWETIVDFTGNYNKSHVLNVFCLVPVMLLIGKVSLKCLYSVVVMLLSMRMILRLASSGISWPFRKLGLESANAMSIATAADLETGSLVLKNVGRAALSYFLGLPLVTGFVFTKELYSSSTLEEEGEEEPPGEAVRMQSIFTGLTQDLSCLCNFLIYYRLLDFTSAGFLDVYELFCLYAFASLYFPIFLVSILYMVKHNLARRRPTTRQVLKMGTAIPSVVFGLHYGFIAAYTGLTHCADGLYLYAVMVKVIVPRVQVIDDDFLSLTDFRFSARSFADGYTMPVHVFYAIRIARIMWKPALLGEVLYASVEAFYMIVLSNIFLSSFVATGVSTAAEIVEIARRRAIRVEIGETRNLQNFIGSFIFALWVSSLWIILFGTN